MAEARLSPILETIQGAVGDLVFKRCGNRVVISKKPVFQNRKFSRAQKENQKRFKDAAAYGKMALADPELRGRYERAVTETGKPILSVMIGDFLHPPTVDHLDLSEYDGKSARRIHVRASDDFGVARVNVVIFDGGGNVVEQGAAVHSSGNAWTYTTTVSVQVDGVIVEATAFDLPGHSVSRRSPLR